MRILALILVIALLVIVFGALINNALADRRARKREEAAERAREIELSERQYELERKKLELDLDRSWQDRINSPIKQKDVQ